MMPENGSEKLHFVLGKQCIQIFEWNDHYIKDDAINDIIVFDVSEQKYYNWEDFKWMISQGETTLGVTSEEHARKNLRRLRYKVFKPIDSIPMKKCLKTKKKIENKYVCTPSSK